MVPSSRMRPAYWFAKSRCCLLSSRYFRNACTHSTAALGFLMVRRASAAVDGSPVFSVFGYFFRRRSAPRSSSTARMWLALSQFHLVPSGACQEAKVAEEQAQKVQQQIVRRRRAKILPSADDLQKIGRYESLLSKEMYRALHELEALQERRRGGKLPLARLDVQLP